MTNDVQIMINITKMCLYFVDLTTFYILGQIDHFLYSRAEICQIFQWFFGKFKKLKRHSEIN